MFTQETPLPGESFYTQIPTHWIRDPRLTGNAYKVISFWKSHQIGYRVTLKQTIAETGLGRDAVYSAVKCLVTHGYLVRRQVRNDSQQFDAVEYTLGPAAAVQTYARQWGNGNGPGVAAASTDADVSAGETASGFSVSGSPVYGEPAPKKIKVKKIREKKITTPPSAPAPAPPIAATVRGGGEPKDETPTAVLVVELIALNPRLTAATVRRVIGEERAAGRTFAEIAAAARVCYADPETRSAGRLRQAGPWWTAPLPRAPWPDWCGHCNPATRFNESDPDRPYRCPTCAPKATTTRTPVGATK